ARRWEFRRRQQASSAHEGAVCDSSEQFQYCQNNSVRRTYAMRCFGERRKWIFKSRMCGLTQSCGAHRYSSLRSCGRVAEGGGLLNRYTLQRRIEGSNPSGSARCQPPSSESPLARCPEINSLCRSGTSTEADVVVLTSVAV